MDKIIDDNRSRKTDYTRKSFYNFLYVLLAFSFIMLNGLLKFFNVFLGEIFDSLIAIAVLLIIVFSILGLINGIKSFRKKEPKSIQKYIGLIGNLLFILLGISIIIVNVIDVLNWINK